jgi:hypothetical protein
VFAYDTATGQTIIVASPATLLPVDRRPMEFAAGVDTDGQHVSFVASAGFIPFGGTAEVCVANADGTNLRSIARYGEAVPGLPGKAFRRFGRTAVDDGIVWFQGLHVDGSSERTSLFAHVLATDTTIPVILYGQAINGVTGNTPWFDPRGVDGPDAVIMCDAPTASMGVSINSLVHAHIDVSAPCIADLDNGTGTGSPDGGVDVNDLLYFLDGFEVGSVAVDLDNGTGTGTPDGGVDINDLLYFLVRYEAGC